MTAPVQTPIPQAANCRAAIAAALPVLRTQRLTLRAPRLEDWPLLAPIWRTRRSKFIGGPYSTEDAWLDFSQSVASWVLRGIGYWTVTLSADDSVLGLCGLGQEYCDPEPEFGWLFTRAAEGHGYATEATRAIRDHLFAGGISGFVSYIDAGHARSIAVAERLGAWRDPDAAGADATTFVYRHTCHEARP
ncbi:MAG: GNAT family N-acetyltransferase [Rhodobacter sp.]|jgi:RimJ/RimL family protein N-acetyltransferase|nr:GNAT family N-acetyltransferase [Rhodobacter sp.]